MDQEKEKANSNKFIFPVKGRPKCTDLEAKIKRGRNSCLIILMTIEKNTSDQKVRFTKIWYKSKKKKKKTEKECDEKNMAIEEKKRKTW